ncbi:MucR family transcriptional regulator [Arvimicrobium flavum]|uniref:MucR family transcriptional regulator n=1 Tax=Arvimicrobium flavum TaxID=3393320 RepID=UPI00237A1E26|nr:MucR family transcriptional regulator [Mesorhizobium shangrilense]
MIDNNTQQLLELTADVTSAYVSNNPVPASELAALIAQVHLSMSQLANPGPASADEPLKPAVNPKRSVHDDYIVCLEDGKQFKSLKRHLMTHHNMTPDQYRAKWNLPADYPMVAPAYAAARSALAKKMGLGRNRKKAPQPAKPARKKTP